MLHSLLIFALGAAPAPPSPSVYLPPNLYLVRATTVKMWKDPNRLFYLGRLKVTAVVGGPNRLLGREFDADTRTLWTGPTQGTMLAPPRLVRFPVSFMELGAEGLWWVTENPKDHTLAPEQRVEIVRRYRLNDFQFRFPYQISKAEQSQSGDTKAKKMWKEGEDWAKAVSAVYAAKSDGDRRLLLQRYAATANSPIAAWAMSLLVRGGSVEPTTRFLRDLTKNDKLGASSQVALDEMLCQLDPKGWVGSTERRSLLERWLAGKSNIPNLFTFGCKRLLDAVGAGEIDAKLFGELVVQTNRRKDLNEGEIYDLCLVITKMEFGPTEKDKAAVRAIVAEVKQTGSVSKLRMTAWERLNELTPP